MLGLNGPPICEQCARERERESREDGPCWLGPLCLASWIGIIATVVAIMYGCQPARAADVKLAWNANSAAENVTAYRIYRLGTPNVVIATVTAPTATVTAFPGEMIAVSAVNSVGESPLSTAIVVPEPAPLPLPPMDRTGWAIHRVSSEEIARENTPAARAIDPDAQTFWHTQWETLAPHYIALKLPRPALVSAFYYLPRQDGRTNGHITEYDIESSDDGETWEPWLKGQWANDASQKVVVLPLRPIRYVRVWGAARYAAAGDIHLGGTYVPEPPASETRTIQHSLDLQTWTDIAVLPGPPPTKEFIRIKKETTP
jgi:hypothetical protein